MSDLSPAAVAERVNSLHWVHSIDLGEGLVTRGEWGAPSPVIKRAFDAIDFRDKKVLDIGCWDGLWSFEAERRGAREVHATDCVSQRWGGGAPTLLTAREVLGSSIRYDPHLSVYDAPARFPERDFDIVIFAGVYYHLKDPLLALARLRQVLKTGGHLLVEGAAMEDPRNSYATFWYKDRYWGDRSNWWIPTTRCLREWIECSYFAVKSEHLSPPERMVPSGIRHRIRRMLGRQHGHPVRVALTAEAVERADPGYAYADAELSGFDLTAS